jgi:low affinity Fe/Cu permease
MRTERRPRQARGVAASTRRVWPVDAPPHAAPVPAPAAVRPPVRLRRRQRRATRSRVAVDVDVADSSSTQRLLGRGNPYVTAWTRRQPLKLRGAASGSPVFDRGGAGYSYKVPLPSPGTDSRDDRGSVRVTPAHPRRRFTNLESLRGPHHTRSSNLLHRLGAWSSKAVAGVTVACLLAGWGIVGIIAGFPSWWQVALYSTTSAVTVVMVFAIQHTQHREQLVTQRKLDELVRAQPAADDRLIAAEAATDAELDNLIEANDL